MNANDFLKAVSALKNADISGYQEEQQPILRDCIGPFAADALYGIIGEERNEQVLKGEDRK